MANQRSMQCCQFFIWYLNRWPIPVDDAVDAVDAVDVVVVAAVDVGADAAVRRRASTVRRGAGRGPPPPPPTPTPTPTD